VSQRVLVACAHADDETLGCGGTLLKHRAAGDVTGWILGTSPTALRFDAAFVARRKWDIALVAEAYGMSFVRELGFPAAGLDMVPRGDVIAAFAAAINEFAPDIVYVVHRGDVHSDHGRVFEGVWAALKPLRDRVARRVLAFETLSSTNLAAPRVAEAFVPQAYCDIGELLDRKIEIYRLYETEIQQFPAPRSPEAVAALARFRGTSVHVEAAEAFMVLRDLF